MKNQIGKLFIVATPIGNLEDITIRAINTLKSVDSILCEDTRVSKILLQHHMIDRPLFVYNDHSDENTRKKIIAKLEAGHKLALISDAGTPLIADPGYKLIGELRHKNIPIETIPGPCSVVAALTLSGLPTDRFTFVGFLPHKTLAKEKVFAEFLHVKTSLVCFETANRLIDTLELMKKYYADRIIVIARELTKLYEEIIRGDAQEVINYYQSNTDKLRGEIVMVISPFSEEISDPQEQILSDLSKLMQEMSLRDAVDAVASQYAMSKKQIYKLALQLKDLA
jgi:16S rRNA (cytidine1402-2'-O)-methyltransferase